MCLLLFSNMVSYRNNNFPDNLRIHLGNNVSKKAKSEKKKILYMCYFSFRGFKII